MPPGYVVMSHPNGTNIYFCSAAGAQEVVAMHPNAHLHTHQTDLRQRMTTDRPPVDAGDRAAGRATADRNVEAAKQVAAEVAGVVAGGNYVGVVVNCQHGCERTPLVAALLFKQFGQAATTDDAMQLVSALWDEREDGNLTGYVAAYLAFMDRTGEWG